MINYRKKELYSRDIITAFFCRPFFTTCNYYFEYRTSLSSSGITTRGICVKFMKLNYSCFGQQRLSCEKNFRKHTKVDVLRVSASGWKKRELRIDKYARGAAKKQICRMECVKSRTRKGTDREKHTRAYNAI